MVLQKGQFLANLVSFYHTIGYWLYYFHVGNDEITELLFEIYIIFLDSNDTYSVYGL